MLNTLAQSWLELQCRMIPSVQRGLVVVGATNTQSLVPTACWPERATMPRELTEAARLALEQSQPVVRGQQSDSETAAMYGIACPLLVEGKVFGVVAVEARGAIEQQRAVMQLLQWGANWLEFLVQREASAVTGRLVNLVEIIAAGLEQRHFSAASMAAATELSRVLAGVRVSIGFVEGRRARLRALSHSANFADKANLVRAIEAAMDEALDQRAMVVFPALDSDKARLTRAHEALAAMPGTGSICTVPFGDDHGMFGAVVVERDAKDGFDSPSVELCEAVAALVGPILESKRLEDRWLAAKALDSLNTYLRRLFGPRHLKLKLAVSTLVAVTLFIALATGTYRVSAPAGIESIVQRVVVAPRDGYLASAEVRAGDVVREGQLLARLNTEELELERTKLTSEREQLLKEHREAFATGSRAQTRIMKARLSQVNARAALLEAQIQRSRMTAPFEGVVVEGDLSQSLGAAVSRGQTLLQIAPLDRQRVIIEIDESDISAVKEGQTGELRLTAFASEQLPFVVERITPVSKPEDRRNFFRIEARLLELDRGLRPGMQGMAKIEIEKRRLSWIWSRDLLDWLRMQLWRWWG